jgi:hypothetical protein
MARLMISFLTGLFVGAGKFEEIKDNLDFERWFRLPERHERRVHGRRHAPNIQLSVGSLFQEAFSGGRSGFVTPFGPFSAPMTPQISVKPWMIPPIPCLT